MKTRIQDLLLVPALITGLALIPAGRVAAQTFRPIYGFTGGDDGGNPFAPLILSGSTLYGTTTDGRVSGNGTVFKVNLDGSGFTTLHSFAAGIGSFPYSYTNTDGADPVAGLLVSGNTLYGTALGGGSSGNGTVFALNTDGTGFKVLHSFTATDSDAGTNSDGINPYGGLVLSGNTLYGTAARGGGSGYGAVFKVSTSGAGFASLYSFTGGSDGSVPVGGLILSGNTLYGTATSGTVFKVNTDGTGFATLYTFTGGNDGAEPEGTLVLSGNTLYGTAASGGDSGSGTVFKVNTDGSGYATLHNFTDDSDGSNSDGADPSPGLVLSSNTLYGTAATGGGLDHGTVFAVKTDGAGFTTLYNFTGGNGGGDPVAGLLLAGNTLYGTTTDEDTGDLGYGGTLFSLSLGSIGTQQGSLQVTVAPSGAVASGAQWQVDGGSWQESGAVVSALTVGNHTVTFKTIGGWTAPANQTVSVSANSTATASGTYLAIPQTGSLEVTITPSAAVSAGAEWQVDAGAYELSAATVTNLPVGSHTVSFTALPGWSTPVSQTVTIKNGATTEVTGVYTAQAKGNPKLTITSPKSAQVLSSAALLVSGTVTDKVAVEDVYYQLNGGAWTLATAGNAWSNWTASVTLSPGINTVCAYAVDTSGTFSTTNKIVVNYNPLLPEQGTFNGLFLDTNDVAEASSGFFTMALTASGAFTGKIMTSGGIYNLPTTAKFDLGGQVQFTLLTKQNTLTFNLQLDLSEPASQRITGTVAGGAWTAELTADRAVFSASTNKALNYEGQYTLAIAGNEDPAASPGGFGWATLSISPAGLITMVGNLPDGTALSQPVSVSKDGRWPFYVSYAAPPAGNGGALFGWITFSNSPAAALGGTLHWFRPAGKTPAAYQSGFTNLAVMVTGSAYNAAAKPLLPLTSGQVTLDGGNLPFAITNQVTFVSNGTINVSPPNTDKLALTINKTTGAITGSFANPPNPKQTIKLTGVMLQGQTNAVGYFLGASQSGAFFLDSQ